MNRVQCSWVTAGLLSTCVLTAGWLYTAPYRTLDSIEEAAKANDREALEELVDFPSVRESLKEELKASLAQEMVKLQDNPFAALGMALGSAIIDPIVDSVASPTGILALTEKQPPENKSRPPAWMSIVSPVPNIKMAYASTSKFLARVLDETTGKDSLVLVLRRDGLTWRLTSIRIPGFIEQKNAEGGCQIVGNTRSLIYHKPGGQYYFQMRLSPDAICFKNEEDALSHGYRLSQR